MRGGYITAGCNIAGSKPIYLGVDDVQFLLSYDVQIIKL
jgi:hypothetical protein